MLFALVVCLAWAMQLYVVTNTVSRPFADFIVFWSAARLPDNQVYDPIAVTQAAGWYFNAFALRPFSYPPSALALFRSFAGLDFLAAAWLWTVLSAVAFVYAVSRWGGVSVALLSIVTPPALYALVAGQTTLAVGALITAAALQLEKRPLLAGAMLAAAALIKPQLVVLVPLSLAIGGRWTALTAAAAVGATAGSLCILLQGTSLWWAWVESLSHFLDHAEAAHVMGARITPAGIDLPFAQPAGIALGLLTAWAATHLPPKFMLHGAVLASLLVLPYALPYDLTVVAPLACAWLLDRDGPVLGWVVGFALLSALAGAAGLLIATAYLLWLAFRRRMGGAAYRASS